MVLVVESGAAQLTRIETRTGARLVLAEGLEIGLPGIQLITLSLHGRSGAARLRERRVTLAQRPLQVRQLRVAAIRLRTQGL